MVKLPEYLKKNKVVTGPLKVPTRHSHLSLIKTLLCGGKVSFGFKAYNNFGTAVHETFLLGKTKIKLTPEEKKKHDGMIAALRTHPVVEKLMADTIKEVRLTTTVLGIALSYTPDAKKPKKGIDLKTTVVRDIEEFVEKAFEYGYFRQGVTYGVAEGFKEFFIIGITKTSPHIVMIVRIQDHADKLKYAMEELKFLAYFWKHYGTFTMIKDQL